jgi:hypothetical protein
MSGHGKSMVEYDWLTAYETAKKGLVELDEPFEKDRGEGFSKVDLLRIDTMETDIILQENLVMKKEAYTQLSSEAKEVIEMIFNAPAEILECFMAPKYNKVSKNQIKNYLLINGWNPNIVRNCFAELRSFVANF